MSYIVTFYAHIGAIRYKKLCEAQGIQAAIMPVPRDLSSSCGSCVRTENGYAHPAGKIAEEVEQIAEVTGDGYRVIYSS